jgi:uncharacterized membrane protein YqjE
LADAKPEGLLASLKHIGATLLGTVQTRLALLGNEIEVQKFQALRLLVLAQALLICAVIGVMLTVALVTVLLWEHRLIVVGVFAALFLVATAAFYRALRRQIDEAESPFAATLAELQNDIHLLKAASTHAKTPV